MASYNGGPGGRDIVAEEFFEMASEVTKAYEEKRVLPKRLLFTASELENIRKLQTVAHVAQQGGRNEKG